MSRLTIIPDIHGRRFWNQPAWALAEDSEFTIFLGDYMDPYEDEEITPDDVISNFKDIIEFKSIWQWKAILLIGNHDYQYLHNVAWSRYNFDKYQRYITAVKDEFQIAFQYDNYLFTHAGVSKLFLQEHLENYNVGESWGSRLNSLYEATPKVFEKYSFYRGGWGDYGSPIWMDIRECVTYDETGKEVIDTDKLGDGTVQIFGHTMLTKPYIGKYISDLDCHKVFTLDTETGEIQEY